MRGRGGNPQARGWAETRELRPRTGKGVGLRGVGLGGGEAGLQRLDKVCPEKVNRDQPFLHWDVLHPHP